MSVAASYTEIVPEELWRWEMGEYGDAMAPSLELGEQLRGVTTVRMDDSVKDPPRRYRARRRTLTPGDRVLLVVLWTVFGVLMGPWMLGGYLVRDVFKVNPMGGGWERRAGQLVIACHLAKGRELSR